AASWKAARSAQPIRPGSLRNQPARRSSGGLGIPRRLLLRCGCEAWEGSSRRLITYLISIVIVSLRGFPQASKRPEHRIEKKDDCVPLSSQLAAIPPPPAGLAKSSCCARPGRGGFSSHNGLHSNNFRKRLRIALRSAATSVAAISWVGLPRGTANPKT